MREILNPWANPITYAVPFFVLFIAIELASLRWLEDPVDETPRTGYAFRDAGTSISMGLLSLIFQVIYKIMTFVVFIWLYTDLAPHHLPTGAWWYWIAVIAGVDLGYYANHRFSHRARIGWAGHQAHHSSEYMNFGTALRQKWNPWFEGIFWLPLPLLGFAPWTIYAAFSVNLIFQFFVHTETIDKLPRPIELLFNTPSHHRVHHGCDPEYLDCNYAGILIVWDRLFGTFVPETHRPTYGLTHQVDTYNLLTLQYGEYAKIAHDVRASDTWRERIGYVLGPPGWRP